MSEAKCSPKTNRKTRDYDWSFNFRTDFSCFDDSDDSGVDDATRPAPKRMTESELLKEIDLSSREETVTYKPNPFSIAKINAANRTNAAKRNVESDKAPAISKAARNAGQTTLAQAFKIQKTKALRKPEKPLSSSGKSFDAAKSSLPNLKHQQSFSPAMQHETAELSPKTTVKALNQSDVDVSANGTNGEPVSSTSLPRIRPDIPVETALDVRQCPETTHILTKNGNGSTNIALDFGSCHGLEPPNVESRNLHAASPLQNVVIKAHIRSPILSFSSPVGPASRDAHTNLNPDSYYDRYSSPMRPPHSNIRPNFSVSRMIPRLSNSRLSPKPFLPRFNAGIMPSERPFSGMHVVPPVMGSFKSEEMDEGLRNHSRTGVSTGGLHFTQMTGPIKREEMNQIFHEHSIPDTSLVGKRETADQIPTLKFEEPSAIVHPIYSPYKKPDIRARTTLASNPISAPQLFSSSRRIPPRPSSPSFRELRSRNHSPSPPISTSRRNGLDKFRPVKDAYTFSVNDPDEEWTTLPPRKKAKPNPKSAMPSFKQSFTVPGLLPLPPTARKETSMTSGRRVHVYIPPPPPTSAAISSSNTLIGTTVSSGATSPRNREPSFVRKIEQMPDRDNFDMDAYPSPSSSRLHKRSPPKNPRIGNEFPTDSPSPKKYRPLSPPTSDLVIPPSDDHEDISLPVQLLRIRKNYAPTRAFLRKRRLFCSQTWDFLGLESCGVVRKDEDNLGLGERKEIQIVTWSLPQESLHM